MKWSMMATEQSIQFNLEPENAHERKLLDSLSEYGGTATLHKGVQVHECMGGYLRDFGSRPGVLAITISPTPQQPATGGDGGN